MPFPTIIDYYWMHKYVQYDIVERYGYGMEVFVIGTKGSGRLDIYDGYTNSYYEVKHILAATGKHFEDQLAKYDAAHVVGWRFSEYSIEGNVSKGTARISGNTEYLYWDISYRTAEDGVIIYTWALNKERYEVYLATLAVTVTYAVAGVVNAQFGSMWDDLCAKCLE